MRAEMEEALTHPAPARTPPDAPGRASTARAGWDSDAVTAAVTLTRPQSHCQGRLGESSVPLTNLGQVAILAF